MDSNGKRMETRDLVAAISVRAGQSLKKPPNTSEAQVYYRATVAAIAEALQAGNSVSLAGLGSLRPAKFGPRIARDLRTGAPLPVGPRQGVRFRLSKPLRDKLNHTNTEKAGD